GAVTLDAPVIGRSENLAGKPAETDHSRSFQNRDAPAWKRRIAATVKPNRAKERPECFWTLDRRRDKRGHHSCQLCASRAGTAKIRHTAVVSRKGEPICRGKARISRLEISRRSEEHTSELQSREN